MNAENTKKLVEALNKIGTVNGVRPVGNELTITITTGNVMHTFGIPESEIDNHAAVIAKVQSLNAKTARPAPKVVTKPAAAPAPVAEPVVEAVIETAAS